MLCVLWTPAQIPEIYIQIDGDKRFHMQTIAFKLSRDVNQNLLS